MKLVCVSYLVQDLGLKDMILEAHYKGQQVPGNCACVCVCVCVCVCACCWSVATS